MTVKEIVRAYLTKHHIDGLCADDCGCGIDDLFPCTDGPFPDCETAKRITITKRNIGRYLCSDAQVGDDIYTPIKTKRRMK